MNETESTPQNPVEPTFEMLKYRDFVKRIGVEILKTDIDVVFGEWEGDRPADYLNKTLHINLKVAPKVFFESITPNLMAFTVRELSRECTDSSHSHSQMCAWLAGEMLLTALKNPAFFDMEMSRLYDY